MELGRPNRILADFFQREELWYLDLLPQFRTEYEKSDIEYYIPDDGHWNKAGHRLSARMIVDELQRKESVE